jgi:hypothetical protein
VSIEDPIVSRYGTLILIVAAVLVCGVAAILRLPFAKTVEHEEDGEALKTAGDIAETKGMISGYSIGTWTHHFDMSLDASMDTSDAAIIAYQVCSELKIPVHRPWIARFYLADGHKAAECEIEP